MVGEGHAAQTLELDPCRLLQDDAGGQALDLGQRAPDVPAAVGARPVHAAQDGATPHLRRPVSGFAPDRS